MSTLQQTYRTVQVPGGLRAGIWEPDGDVAGNILAIHGVTSSHLAFAAVARALPEYRIIGPDLRGRGRSNQLGGPYGMARHADDLMALLDHLGVAEVLPVGHSMGAFVAVVLAHRHPSVAGRLVLVDGGIPLELPEGVSAEESIAAILGPAAERLAMTFPTIGDYRALWQQHPAFHEFWNGDVEAYADYDTHPIDAGVRPATGYEALAEDTRDLGRPDGDLIAALDALSIPAVFLQAERGMLDQPEGLFRDDYLAGWLDRLPTVAAHKVEGVNHYTIVFAEPGVDAIATAVREGR